MPTYNNDNDDDKYIRSQARLGLEQPVFYRPDALPSYCPANSINALKESIIIINLKK